MSKKFDAYKEIESLINKTLNVRLISEELTCFDLSDKIEEAKNYMISNRFDCIGITDNKRVIGYTDLITLESAINRISYVEFKPGDIISSNTSLMETLELINQKDYLFVLDGTTINRIVTKADIYKDPVRLYIYNLISNFEVLLSLLIEHYYADDEWMTELTEARLNGVKKIYNDRLKENTDFNMFDCLPLEDKITLFSNPDKELRKLLKTSGTQQRVFFKNLKKIRNSVSHVGKKPAVTDINKILDTITNTTKFSRELEAEISRLKIDQ